MLQERLVQFGNRAFLPFKPMQKYRFLECNVSLMRIEEQLFYIGSNGENKLLPQFTNRHCHDVATTFKNCLTTVEKLLKILDEFLNNCEKKKY